MDDYLFRGSLAQVDASVFKLTQLEEARQVVKLILIPSESQAPLAVREALGSAFQNIYAEGYPDEESRQFTEGEILDYELRLAHFRRYSDPRYYKGVEYADVVEALARRRVAELFATNGYGVDDLYANVQPLSGAPANNAVYHALVNPGDTILGMSLLHGGHLTHGSSVNRSGKYYRAAHYTVDPVTQKIDYDQIAALAQQHKPKMIIAGYSSYPWTVDWKKFREIASSCGAFLLADIAHVAGLVAGGVYPSPVGYADVITFTTHKSMCGPRGAVILTTDAGLARKIDKAVFPGEQGGPHVNVFAAMAVAFKLAGTDQFHQLQSQIVKNCRVFADRLKSEGLRVAYGGTDTHLLNLDVTSIIGEDETTLSGDQAARILDIAGIVVNRNTIPGDRSATDPSGIRMGTPWVTQRGFKEQEMEQLADLIAGLLKTVKPYRQSGRHSETRRAKVDFSILEQTKIMVRELALQAGADFEFESQGYPHFYFIDDKPEDDWRTKGLGARISHALVAAMSDHAVLEVKGARVRSFLNYALSSDVDILNPGEAQPTRLFVENKIIRGVLKCIEFDQFELSIPEEETGVVGAWLRALVDGYVDFGDELVRKLPGMVVIRSVPELAHSAEHVLENSLTKPYYIGIAAGEEIFPELPVFEWIDNEDSLQRTPLYSSHKELGAKIIPFAGWEMPVWYSGVVEEHLAVRQAAGIFDVAHMGVYQAEGTDAEVFLDSVTGNDIGGLAVGESCYTHFLDPDANVIDDLLVYRRGPDKFLLVVNASNDAKNWAWLNAVMDGKVKIDPRRPWARAFGRQFVLRNLRDRTAGEDMRVDIALQGPRARDILLALGTDDTSRRKILALKRTELCDAMVGGFDLITSRTGYTGEKMAFELFVHPDRAEDLFKEILKAGDAFGIKPIGLGARDSLRTEAGLPLFGHEMGIGSGKSGQADLGVGEAGFGSYVKTYKPWFIGREAFMAREKSRLGIVVRFRFDDKGVRMAHNGDPVLDKRGRVIGWVTSCAVDQEGYLTGQSFVESKSADEGTAIYIYQSATDKTGKAPADYKIGDRAILPTPATILSRFPK